MVTHELKSWPRFFEPIMDGRRTHELRRNDRGFAVGDVLILREYDPFNRAYTGRVCRATITSITSDTEPCAESRVGLDPEFCILSVKVVAGSSNLEMPATAHRIHI